MHDCPIAVILLLISFLTFENHDMKITNEKTLTSKLNIQVEYRNPATVINKALSVLSASRP